MLERRDEEGKWESGYKLASVWKTFFFFFLNFNVRHAFDNNECNISVWRYSTFYTSDVVLR